MTEIEKIFANLEKNFMGASSERFSEKTVELASEPRNTGELTDADGKGLARGECGDTITVFLKTDNGTITDARFLADGCGATLACGSAVTELAKGRSLFYARSIYPQTIIKFLGGLPASHMHCSVLAVHALRKALEHIDINQEVKDNASNPV